MTAETVRFDTDPSESQRLAMCDWFHRHGIDPKWIPMDSAINRWLLPDLPGIEYDRYVLDGNGHLVIDARSSDDCPRETLWFPMEADPLPFPPIAPLTCTGGPS